MRSEEYDLLVFDELVYVLDYKFLDLEEVIAEIKKPCAKNSRICIWF
jgi:ATP:corrinoid adenosyltransferase